MAQDHQWKRLAQIDGWQEAALPEGPGLRNERLDRDWPTVDWEAAARDSGIGAFEDEAEVIEFREQASRASYHHADDSGREWSMAKPYQRRCQEIYDAASDDLKEHLEHVTGDYLISIKRRSTAA